MKKNFIVLVTLVLLAGLLMASCSKGERSSGSEDGAKVYNFVYLSPNQGNPFWVSVSQGVEDTVATHGGKLTIYDAQDDPAKQINQAEDALLGGIDALFLSPFETDTGTAITDLCIAAKVPCFILDTGSNSAYTAFITSDNEQGGQIAAQFLVQNTGNDRIVFEMQGLLGRAIPALRGKGFNKEMDAQGIKVDYVQPADFNRSKGMDLMETFLTRDGGINAVFCWNDEMALGAKEAIAARNLSGKILIIGFDATDEAVQAVIDGELAATVAQNPYGFGQQGVDLAYKHLAGEPIEKDVYVPCQLITKENAQAYLSK
jgi:ribose transport system substrate-binding protein